MEAHSYEVDLGWQYDRLGQLSSASLTDRIEVATPPEFPKGMAGIWSPEHLLVAAVSGCFMITFLAIAENFQLEFEDFDCKAIGKLEKTDRGLLMTAVELFPKVLLVHESDTDKAGKVLLKAEKACLISNSISAQVSMQPTIHVAVKAYD
jgi:peroxiredoxin-like protein